MKAHTGWNFCSHSRGAAITKGIVDLYVAGRIKAVIGQVADFAEVPEAFEAMSKPDTVSPVVVRALETNAFPETYRDV